MISKNNITKSLMILGVALLLSACASSNKEASYKQITMEEAVALMKESEDYIILDVRTEEEFAGGHIQGAVCVPNETIGDEAIEELPDKAQMILVYCRSGNRSKQASQKLADMGYTNIIEFGGIIDWEGEIVSQS